MATDLIEERSGVPRIVGTRITVDDVLLYLLDPEMTEELIGRVLDLTTRQVNAARAYILANPDATLSRHLRLEDRLNAAVNPPEVIERARQVKESLEAFRLWRATRETEEAREAAEHPEDNGRTPSFRKWLAEQEASRVSGP